MTWQQILALGVTGSIAAALVAAFAGWLNDRSRRRFELQRWRAEFYLRPKLEALRNLHAALVRSHFEINRRAKARMPQNDQEFRDLVERQEMEFLAALTLAEIYLNPETSDAMHVVLGAVRQMVSSIFLRLPEVLAAGEKYRPGDEREPDWRSFHSSFDAAHARLKALLHPDELMKWIENYGH